MAWIIFVLCFAKLEKNIFISSSVYSMSIPLNLHETSGIFGDHTTISISRDEFLFFKESIIENKIETKSYRIYASVTLFVLMFIQAEYLS